MASKTLTPYRAAMAFFNVYDRWDRMTTQRPTFFPFMNPSSMGVSHKEIRERISQAFDAEMARRYFELLDQINTHNAEVEQRVVTVRTLMDDMHRAFLEAAFPLNEHNQYTVHDACTGCKIAFTVEKNHFVSGSRFREEGKRLMGFIDFSSPDISATHARFYIEADNTIYFTTQEDIC